MSHIARREFLKAASAAGVAAAVGETMLAAARAAADVRISRQAYTASIRSAHSVTAS